MSTSSINRFNELGFSFPHKAFTQNQAKLILKEYRETENRIPDHSTLKSCSTVFKPHMLWMWADHLAHHPAILDVVQLYLGPNIFIWSMDVFRRPPVTQLSSNPDEPLEKDIAPIGLNWHQDSLYLGLEPANKIVRVWLPLTQTTIENGTLLFWEGSHKNGTLSHKDTHTHSSFDRGPSIEAPIDSMEVVPVCMKPGYFSVHDIRTAHCSGENRTNEERVAISMTYLAADVKPVYPASAMLVRGTDLYKNFSYEKRPEYNFDAVQINSFYAALINRVNLMKHEGIPLF